MDQEYEIRTLAVETLAIQMILVNVLRQIGAADPSTRNAIAAGLNEAANTVEHVAITLGKTAKPEHTTRALQIVEQIRTAVLGDESEPKHGV